MLCVGVTLSQTHTSTVCLWYSRKYEVHNYCSSWWIDDPLRLISTHGVLLKESHLEPFQSSCRSQTTICKYKVHSTVVSLPQSGRNTNCHLLLREHLVRMVKSQPKTTKRQVSLLEDSCQCPQSSVFYINMSWEAAVLKETLPPDAAPLRSIEVCCWSHGQRKNILEEKSVVTWN